MNHLWHSIVRFFLKFYVLLHLLFSFMRKVFKVLTKKGGEVIHVANESRGKGEITHAKIEQVLGKAMVDAEFQEKLFDNPEKLGRELGLNDSGIELIKKVDRKTLKTFTRNLNAKLIKDAAAIIFCASY